MYQQAGISTSPQRQLVVLLEIFDVIQAEHELNEIQEVPGGF